jgi:hypothetical protein
MKTSRIGKSARVIVAYRGAEAREEKRRRGGEVAKGRQGGRERGNKEVE